MTDHEESIAELRWHEERGLSGGLYPDERARLAREQRKLGPGDTVRSEYTGLARCVGYQSSAGYIDVVRLLDNGTVPGLPVVMRDVLASSLHRVRAVVSWEDVD